MSTIFQRGPVKPEMNMTPLIDVTFLLIVFFMLVNNIAASERIPLVVPALTDPKTRQLGEEIQKIIVSVAPAAFTDDDRLDDPLNHPGLARFVQVGSGAQFSMDNLAGVTEALQIEVKKNPQVEVLLRADAALYFSEVQPVMDAITGAGVGVVNLVARMPEE